MAVVAGGYLALLFGQALIAEIISNVLFVMRAVSKLTGINWAWALLLCMGALILLLLPPRRR